MERQIGLDHLPSKQNVVIRPFHIQQALKGTRTEALQIQIYRIVGHMLRPVLHHRSMRTTMTTVSMQIPASMLFVFMAM